MEGIVLKKEFVERAEREFAKDKDGDPFAIYGILCIEGSKCEFGLYAICDENGLHYLLTCEERETHRDLGEARSNTPYGVYEFNGNKFVIKKEVA